MKERFFIRGTVAGKITYYHLIFFAMALPFDRLYSELALISLCLHTLIHLEKEQMRAVRLRYMLLPAAVYLLTVAGTAYTKHYDEAFYEWERQLAILLFPLIVLYNSFDFRRYLLNILLALSASCFAALIYLYVNTGYSIWQNQLPLSAIFSNAFINHNFSAAIDMHATYFSMYIALSAITVLYCLVNSVKGISRIIYGIMLLVLAAGLIQLCSRAVLIAIAVIVNLVIPFFLLQKRQRPAYMLLSVIFSLSVIYGVTRIDNFKTRFIVELKEDLTQVGVNNNSLEPRSTRWACAWELIKQSPVYGHGSGSEIALLKEIYYQRKLFNSYLNELNVHNQYLSFLIKTGAIGLFIFLYMLYKGFRAAVRCKDIFFCSFLVIVAVVSFSENILDANKGIFFYSFFFSLFYLREGRREF
jgi:O-antigen ligase